MKGVLLAGGTGSRLLPLTRATNKHLLPVGQRAMVEWPLLQLQAAGVEEVAVVAGAEHLGDLIRYLGDGSQWEMDLQYHVQAKPNGIGGALLAVPFSWWERAYSVAVILGDNFFLDREWIGDEISTWKDHGRSACHLFGVEVDNPQECGVAEVDGEEVIGLEEKPAYPRSSLAVTGLYLYRDAAQVRTRLRELTPSARGELEITDLNRSFLCSHPGDCKHRGGATLTQVREGSWVDCGTWPGYQRAQALSEKMA